MKIKFTVKGVTSDVVKVDEASFEATYTAEEAIKILDTYAAWIKEICAVMHNGG